jgi:hypothetical protein
LKVKDARDPFYSKANQTELKKRAQDVSDNKIEKHEIIIIQCRLHY